MTRHSRQCPAGAQRSASYLGRLRVFPTPGILDKAEIQQLCLLEDIKKKLGNLSNRKDLFAYFCFINIT